MDDTTKTCLIDDSANVEQITEVICQKLGIQNPEEFSLKPIPPPGASPSSIPPHLFSSFSLLYFLSLPECNWLATNKPLHEQGITRTDIVLLAKRFFYSDNNISKDDPVQLHLLYAQCQSKIVEGTLPVTKDEAVMFAALQTQIEHGNYNPARHKLGFLEYYLPIS